MKDKIIQIIKGYECDAYFGADLNHLKESDYINVADAIINLFATHDKEQIWDMACRKTLSDISDTFLDENNLKKSFSQSDKDVFIALGETIKNFPLPKALNTNNPSN